MGTPAPGQTGIGNYIAQADRGGIATVSVYEVAPPPPPDEAAVAAAVQFLADMPTDRVPDPVALAHNSRMPLPRNPLFTGRAPELRWLAEHLGPSSEQVPTVVLSGLGGVGKSQIAIEYAHRFGRYYAGGVYWVSLADPATMDAEVAACGGPEGMQLRPDFPQLSVEQQVRLVKAAWQSPLPRLLVFDNCEDEQTLVRWRPSSGGCRVLVTSRNPLWEPALGVAVFELDVLPSDDGVALLAHYREATSPEDAQALADTAAELGQLPLALHLAGSYLSRYRRAVSPAAYLDQLRSSPLIDHRSLTAAGISPTDHIQSIAATFAVSVDRLAEDQEGDELARRCLVTASYLAPGTPVPRTIVQALLGLSESPEDDLELEDALLRLAELGLAQLGIDGTPRLHRLVAAFVQDRLGDKQIQHHVERTLWVLLSPRTFSDSPLIQAAYEPHLRVVAERAIPRGDLESAALSNLLGHYLGRRGDFEGHVRYVGRALEIKEGIFGVDSPQTAKDLNDLGYAYLAGQRTPDLGLRYLERARRLWNPETDAANLAATLDNLGQVYFAIGRLDLAEPLFTEALAIREKVLGEDAYGTSVTVQNLAQLAQERGDLAKAVKLLERAATIRESLGDQCDPSAAARSHSVLASVLELTGDVAAVATHYRRAADLYCKALGPAHPIALVATAQAATYASTHGDPGGATALLDASGVLQEGLTRALQEGLMRGQTLASVSATVLNNSGFAAWFGGDYTQARTLYELALTRGGPEATTLNNLGMIEERLGRYDDAVRYYRRSLDAMGLAKAPGRTTALKARVLNNLGVSLTLGGDPDAGNGCLTEALDMRRQLQGCEGPDYAVTLRNLGLVAEAQGRLDEARALIEQGRDLLARKQGAHSPEYARTMHLLGELHAARGYDEEALDALQIALSVRRTALRPDHPDTAVTLRALAAVLLRLGRWTEACDALVTALPVFEHQMGGTHPWTLQVAAEVAQCAEQRSLSLGHRPNAQGTETQESSIST